MGGAKPLLAVNQAGVRPKQITSDGKPTVASSYRPAGGHAVGTATAAKLRLFPSRVGSGNRPTLLSLRASAVTTAGHQGQLVDPKAPTTSLSFTTGG